MKRLHPETFSEIFDIISEEFGTDRDDITVEFWCRDSDEKRASRFIAFYIPKYKAPVVRQQLDGSFRLYEWNGDKATDNLCSI